VRSVRRTCGTRRAPDFTGRLGRAVGLMDCVLGGLLVPAFAIGSEHERKEMILWDEDQRGWIHWVDCKVHATPSRKVDLRSELLWYRDLATPRDVQWTVGNHLFIIL
jgi:hypothetical protein